MKLGLDTDVTLPVGFIALILSIIAVIIQAVKTPEEKECTCDMPKNEIVYSIVDDKGNVIKQVNKSELKQLH